MDRCPSCRREFERLQDFPLIYIAGFERLPLPEVVGEATTENMLEIKVEGVCSEPIPKEVAELFKRTGKKTIFHQGHVYYSIGKTSEGNVPAVVEVIIGSDVEMYSRRKDITPIFNKAVADPRIEQTLQALEGYVGREVLTQELLELPGFRRGINAGEYQDIGLHLWDDEKTEKGLRVCRVNLSGGWSGRSLSFADLQVDLARMKYEGRIMK